MKQILYVGSSFLAGFAVMTVELVASRIVAPIIGASVFTWTSVIGTTLLGLAVGSFIGGKIADKADKMSERNPLPLAFLFSAILVALIPILSAHTNFITDSSDSISYLNLYLAAYLFLLPTLAIGTIQPMILKKFTDDFSSVGSRYGTLSFAWSAGGILGVFLTGFFFISTIGSSETIWLMSLVLFLVGGIFGIRNKKTALLFILILVVVPVSLSVVQKKTSNPKIVFQKETNYYDAKVIDAYLPNYGNSRILALDFDFHSIEPENKTQYYTEMYPVFGNLKKDIQNILVIGAGAYTMPKYFKSYYTHANVTVAELDPEMITIGNSFFDLKKYNIKTIVGDAKLAIKKDPQKSTEKYDVIFGDAYNSFISVPWYLLTKEWNEEVKDTLSDNGIYAINFIGSVTGSRSEFTKSVLDTFKLSFPNFYIFAFGKNPEYVQNIVLVGIKGDLPMSEAELSQKLSAGENSFLAEDIVPAQNISDTSSVILTDNFAPVEKLMEPTVEDYFPKNLYELKSVLTI